VFALPFRIALFFLTIDPLLPDARARYRVTFAHADSRSDLLLFCAKYTHAGIRDQERMEKNLWKQSRSRETAWLS